MFSKLILHIGSHKTGTTTIQRALHDNPQALSAAGFHYVTKGNHAHAHGFLSPASRDAMLPMGFHLNDPDEFARHLVDHDKDNVIVSSENFSFFFQPDAIRTLQRIVFPLFRKIQIVCYLRRQDSHAVSHHQEGSKPFRTAETQLFGTGLSALPEIEGNPFDAYLDYNQRLGMWADAFGEDNIDLHVFEPGRLKDDDVWLDFCEAISLDPAPFENIQRHNESVGATKFLVGHLCNRWGIREKVKDSLLKRLPQDSKHLPSKDAAEAFYSRYRPGNVALAQRFGLSGPEAIFNDSFESYPETPEDLWDAADMPKAMQTLLHEVASASEINLNADTLRDTGLMYERSGDIELALKFMRAALKRRPSGTWIATKVNQYEKQLGQDTRSSQSPQDTRG